MDAVWHDMPVLLAALGVLGIVGKGAHGLYRFLQRIEASLAYVQKELSFDGGQSLRDESRQTRDLVQQHINDSTADRADMRGQINDIDHRLEAIEAWMNSRGEES